MKRISISVVTLLLSACAATSTPQAIAYREYIAANKPRAEQGLMPWSEYYGEVYSRSLAAGAPASYLNRMISMIDVAKKYEKGEISKDDFMQARRISQTATAADIQANEESERQRRMAAAAAFAGAMNATANQVQPQPIYQIVQPTPLSSPTTQLQPLAPIKTTATAHWTGKQEQVQTVTNKYGWNCEYNYVGRTFWRVFVGSCPSSVEVQ